MSYLTGKILWELDSVRTNSNSRDTIILPAGSISTPLFIDDRIIIGHDKGMELYQVSAGHKLVWLDSLNGPMFDSTPVAWEGRVYAGSKDGFLYCLGEVLEPEVKDSPISTPK